MKKKIIAMLMGLIAFSSLPLGACKKEEKNEEKTQTSVAEEVTLYNFETGVNNVFMSTTFGRITLNEEEKYVSEGSRSIKLMPTNTKSYTPYMYFPLSSTMLNFAYADVTKIESFKIDVYSEKETSISFGLYFSANADLRANAETFQLKAGWNEIVYAPTYAVLTVQFSLDACQGLYCMFDGKVEEMPVVWLDNLRIMRSEQSIEPEDLIFLKQTEEYREICDFERAYQSLVFVSLPNGNAPSPDLQIIKAADYGLTAPSGEKVLRININPRPTEGKSWTQIQMVTGLLDAVNFPQYEGSLDDYELKFEIYQSESCEKRLLFELNSYYGKGNTAMNWSSVLTTRGQWVSYSAPLRTFEGFIKEPYRFIFAWLDIYGDGEYVYYLDNIRIEKIKG